MEILKLSDIPITKGKIQIERAIESGQSPILFNAAEITLELRYLIDKYNYHIFETWIDIYRQKTGSYQEQHPFKLLLLK